VNLRRRAPQQSSGVFESNKEFPLIVLGKRENRTRVHHNGDAGIDSAFGWQHGCQINLRITSKERLAPKALNQINLSYIQISLTNEQMIHQRRK
jgi:hypothetical protein